jgi:hypothetical protein
LAIAPYELKRRSSDEVGSTFDAESQQYNNGISQLFECPSLSRLARHFMILCDVDAQVLA